MGEWPPEDKVTGVRELRRFCGSLCNTVPSQLHDRKDTAVYLLSLVFLYSSTF